MTCSRTRVRDAGYPRMGRVLTAAAAAPLRDRS